QRRLGRRGGAGSSTDVVKVSKHAMKGPQYDWLGPERPGRGIRAQERRRVSESQRRAPDSPHSCVSTVTPEQCRQWQAEFEIPEGVDLLAPNADFRANSCLDNQFCMYEDFFDAGFRFPVPRFVADLLVYYNQAPAQITPNSWRLIFCYLVLCFTYERRPSLTVFRKLFTMKAAAPDYRCLSARRGTNFLTLSSKYSSNKGYKSRFLFVASSERSTEGVVGWGFPTVWQEFDKTLDQEPRDLSPDEAAEYRFFREMKMIHSAEILVTQWHTWVGGPYDREGLAG